MSLPPDQPGQPASRSDILLYQVGNLSTYLPIYLALASVLEAPKSERPEGWNLEVRNVDTDLAVSERLKQHLLDPVENGTPKAVIGILEPLFCYALLEEALKTGSLRRLKVRLVVDRTPMWCMQLSDDEGPKSGRARGGKKRRIEAKRLAAFIDEKLREGDGARVAIVGPPVGSTVFRLVSRELQSRLEDGRVYYLECSFDRLANEPARLLRRAKQWLENLPDETTGRAKGKSRGKTRGKAREHTLLLTVDGPMARRFNLVPAFANPPEPYPFTAVVWIDLEEHEEHKEHPNRITAMYFAKIDDWIARLRSPTEAEREQIQKTLKALSEGALTGSAAATGEPFSNFCKLLAKSPKGILQSALEELSSLAPYKSVLWRRFEDFKRELEERLGDAVTANQETWESLRPMLEELPSLAHFKSILRRHLDDLRRPMEERYGAEMPEAWHALLSILSE